jgi:acylpyruvate hydrolase
MIIAGYVLALDMTAKCVQQRAMAKKHPWTIAKGFDTFCPVSAPLPVSAIPDTNDVSLWLKVRFCFAG